jgi:hypothetical protein
MSKRLAMWGLVLALAAPGLAQAQVDLSALDKDMPAPRAQVLVLGSMHLSQMPDSFDPESLQPLLDRLHAFKPDIITIEAISGEGCDLLTRHSSIYAGAAEGYCSDTAEAKRATGLDVPAAIAAVHKTLADWPARPTPAQRRRLATLFLAANERASALVQWWQLPKEERRAGDGIDDALLAQLDKAATRRNESYLLGARLAARLGLQRVFAIDDHSGDSIDIDDEAAYGKAIQSAWDNPKIRLRLQQDKAQEERGDMLAYYRHLNSPDNLRLAIDGDFGAALREPSPQHYGRLYVAGWETRNLRMVANIHAAFGERPGARVLSIVGATHKPWFDSLLGQMQGVDIVDAEQVLK